uniref:Uncharacterized protein n=1 Tax=Romanomermis culicivorax TaxID=13658 RepID=A0A915I7U8_ROMCU
MTSPDNTNGDCNVEHIPKDATIMDVALASTIIKNTYTIYLNYDYAPPWEQHTHYNATLAPYVTTPTDSSHTSSQSSEVPLALLALPSTSASTMASNLDMRANSQPTSTANMVMPSKEIATATPIVSPIII